MSPDGPSAFSEFDPASLPRSAWLDIDLEAIAANLGVIRLLAGPGVPVYPVVKANAYGHGMAQVARTLEAAGADGFCVASVDEALALRSAGIRRAILVLYPVPPAWVVEAARRRITITAGDPELLGATLRILAAAAPARRLGIQLEVETGLGRGGFGVAELLVAAQQVEEAPGTKLAGLWTHLQAPEDPAVTAAQVGAFEEATAGLRQSGVRLPRRHVRASGSLVTEGVASYDGVRPGLSIYGLIPDELAGLGEGATAARLRPALALRAWPVRVLDLPAGWGISYGPTFRTGRPSRIATLPIGYGDGWSRALSNRASALVRGVAVPLVGNVAMDAVMADVTDVPGAPVTVADEFVLIGRQGAAEIPIAAVARARNTNTWEVLTGMSRRLPRVYHAASGPPVALTLVTRGDG